MSRFGKICLLCLGPWGLALASAADVQLRAFFQPSTIRLGQSSRYVVEISGDVPPFSCQPPQVDGLRFLPSQGNMQSLQMINGQRVAQSTRTFHVQARRVGSFTIPAQNLSIRGKNYTLPAATLQVLEGAGEDDDEEEELPRTRSGSTSTAAQLSLRLPPEETFYVGQVIPLQVELGFPHLHNLQEVQASYPALVEKAWINGPFSKPRELAASRARGGTAHVWDTTVSAIKSGELPLQYHCIISIQEPMGWFGLISDSREEELFSPKLSVKVANLPTPHPPSFGGGIGHFALRAHISDTQTLLEEPLTLRVELEGEGNWERLSPPELLHNSDEWRIYPPKVDFRPSDALQYRGKKVFDYVIIPLRTGELPVPTVEMSHFDPQKRSYQTLRHAFQEKILVSRNRQISAPATPSGGNAAPKARHGEDTPGDEGKERPKSFSESLFFYPHDTAHFRSLTPLYRQRRFWCGQFFLMALYLGWLGWRYARQRAKDASRDGPRQQRRRMRQCLQKAQKAIEGGQTEVASKALQEALCAFLAADGVTGSPSMTCGEIQQACEKRFQSAEDQKIIRGVCQDLELQHFSPSSVSPETLRKDLMQVQGLLGRQVAKSKNP